MAVPRNDSDFRLLVEYTLQEMAADGTLNSILAPTIPRGESALTISLTPGSPVFKGIPLR
jgi:hypothetical protein